MGWQIPRAAQIRPEDGVAGSNRFHAVPVQATPSVDLIHRHGATTRGFRCHDERLWSSQRRRLVGACGACHPIYVASRTPCAVRGILPSSGQSEHGFKS